MATKPPLSDIVALWIFINKLYTTWFYSFFLKRLWKKLIWHWDYKGGRSTPFFDLLFFDQITNKYPVLLFEILFNFFKFITPYNHLCFY